MEKTLEQVKELISLASIMLKDCGEKHARLSWMLEDALTYFAEEDEIQSKEEVFVSDSLMQFLENAESEDKIANSKD